MYLAQKTSKGKTLYMLRESYHDGNCLRHRHLMDLGEKPGRFVLYPGGNAFYIDEYISDALDAMGVTIDDDTLEDIFWPFVRTDIKRAVGHFRSRSHKTGVEDKLSRDELKKQVHRIHAFDKRRMHFLRFGSMDQGPVTRMPPVLFKTLLGKCRDEIEQFFIFKENKLNIKELKTYVYVAFDLQRFFNNFMARKMPHVQDQESVDHHFLEEICAIDQTIFKNRHRSSSKWLDDYLVRYIIMFFDNDYADSTLLDDFVNQFINQRRRFAAYGSGIEVHTDPAYIAKALACFKITQSELKQMNRKDLVRQYRKMAKNYHPDKGGTQAAFVKLNKAFQTLLKLQAISK